LAIELDSVIKISANRWLFRLRVEM